jgi:hypothetical protein
MLTLRRRYHPLVPAVVTATGAAVGIIAGLATGWHATTWVWWVLIGLVSGYAISGSV